jgi:putative uncharacterized protein (fragment)
MRFPRFSKYDLINYINYAFNKAQDKAQNKAQISMMTDREHILPLLKENPSLTQVKLSK